MPNHLELYGCRHDILGHHREVSTPANFKSLPEAKTRKLGRGQKP